jgi:hypothetical protein
MHDKDKEENELEVELTAKTRVQHLGLTAGSVGDGDMRGA